MRTKKSLLSILLVFIMVLGNSIPLYASAADQAKLAAALLKTSEKLKAEQKAIYDMGYPEFYDTLYAEPNAITLKGSFGLNFLDYENLHAGFSAIVKSDSFAYKTLMNSRFSLWDAGKSKEVVADLNLFVTPEEVSLQVPQLYQSYLMFPIDEADPSVEMIYYSFLRMQAQMQSMSGFFTREELANWGDAYREAVGRALLLAGAENYTSSRAEVHTSYGSLDCDMVTVKIPAAALQDMMASIAHIIREDAVLEKYMQIMSVSYADYFGYGTTAAELAESVASALEEFVFETGLDYTAYISSGGYIVSQSASMELDEDVTVTCTVDTKGQGNLMDEVKYSFYAENSAYNEKYGVSLTQQGTVVPVNGVCEAAFAMHVTMADTEYTDVVTGYSRWDSKLAADNYEYRITLDGSVMEHGYSGYEPQTYEEYVAGEESYIAARTEEDAKKQYDSYVENYALDYLNIAENYPTREELEIEYAAYAADFEENKDRYEAYGMAFLPSVEAYENYYYVYEMMTYEEYLEEYFYDGWDRIMPEEEYNFYYGDTSVYEADVIKCRLAGQGTYTIDSETRTINLDIRKNTFIMNEYKVPFAFQIKIEPVAAGKINVAESEKVNYTTLTEEEAAKIEEIVMENGAKLIRLFEELVMPQY